MSCIVGCENVGGGDKCTACESEQDRGGINITTRYEWNPHVTHRLFLCRNCAIQLFGRMERALGL